MDKIQKARKSDQRLIAVDALKQAESDDPPEMVLVYYDPNDISQLLILRLTLSYRLIDCLLEIPFCHCEI